MIRHEVAIVAIVLAMAPAAPGAAQVVGIEAPRTTRGAPDLAEQPGTPVPGIDPARLAQTLAGAPVSLRRWFDDVTTCVSRTLSSGLDQTRPVARPWGMTVVTDADARMPLAAYTRAHDVPERMVVLVHGLDDPGWVWGSVIAALREAGHVVARMTYPNDGPIPASADLFAGELRALRAAGVRRVDVVAHSMGGLVTRDVLTRAEHYAGDGRGSDALPAIGRLIMCGTPNHGSKMARLRAVAEIQEQLSRAFTGDGVWLGGLADGTGEAADDLLPDSAFLRELNARPLAAHTRYTVIAGRMSPVTKADVAALARRLRDAAKSADAPSWFRRLLRSADDTASGLVDETVRGIGDGCVTIDSARLDGVEDFVVVEANHVSMIANVGVADGVPPGVPIIVERLRDPDAP